MYRRAQEEAAANGGAPEGDGAAADGGDPSAEEDVVDAEVVDEGR